MQALSVVIITFNEEQNIARCINSVRTLADEIIVLDSYSEDNTVPIARSLGATVYFEKFRGYIGQKNLALQYARHNYILSLDADEELDSRLVASILEEKKTFHHRAYRMNRATSYCGRFIRHGLWYPDRQVRLFDRRVAKWGGLNPHDKIILQPGFRACHLAGDILHYSFNSTDDYIWQNNRFSSIAATSFLHSGIRSSWYKMLVRPAWAFLNGFVFKRGFLDGADGFAIAVHSSHQVFLKYSKLYKLQNAGPPKKIPSIPVARETRTSGSELEGIKKLL